MLSFDHSFIVRAPLAAVAGFHRDTRVLRRLTPPPVYVQIHRVEALAEGSISEFTLWFGPLPIRWTARHSEVDPLGGFTDTQVAGPMQHWVHRHAFEPVDADRTRVRDRIAYQHPPGPRGLLTRLLFGGLGLRLTFAYRGWVTRRALEGGRG